MEVRIKDKQAEKLAWQEQEEAFLKCPYAVPNFKPFVDISCYKTIDTQKLYFDEDGILCIDNPS